MLRFKKSISADEGNDEGAEKIEIDTDTILAAGLSRGLTRADADEMTLGMWVDYIIEYNNMQARANKKADGPKSSEEKAPAKSRSATQADFDSF